MMKFPMLKLSLIAAVLTLASTSSNLNAQAPNLQAKFKVPFAFHFDTVQFAPGTYTLGMLNSVTLQVHGNHDGAYTAIRREEARSASATSKVVFLRVGSQYFLHEVWTAGTAKHLVAYPTKAEKQALQAEQAANRSSAPAVEIALAEDGR